MGLEQRVEKLERENRWLKRAFGAALATLTALALLGTLLPQETPDVIEARAFRVIDDNGEQLAELGSYMLGSRLLLLDESGRWRTVLTALDDGAQIALYDRDRRTWQVPR